MKKQIVYFSLLLLQLVTYSVSAQNKGDIIKGKVSEIGGPMVMVSVYERDSINNIVSLGVTDYQGLFSFTLVDPNDIIWVTYPGYDTVVFPIDKLYYEIQLKEKSDLPKVYIVDGPERLTPSRDPSCDNHGSVDFGLSVK